MIRVEITLRDEHQKFIEESVAAGSFITKSEVVAAALDILKNHEEIRRARRAALQREIDKGIAEADSGCFADFSLDSFLAEMKAKRSAKLKSQGS